MEGKCELCPYIGELVEYCRYETDLELTTRKHCIKICPQCELICENIKDWDKEY